MSYPLLPTCLVRLVSFVDGQVCLVSPQTRFKYAPTQSEDGKDELSAAPLERQQGQIAVFHIIGFEQRELLRSICVGIRVISINDDGIGQ